MTSPQPLSARAPSVELPQAASPRRVTGRAAELEPAAGRRHGVGRPRAGGRRGSGVLRPHPAAGSPQYRRRDVGRLRPSGLPAAGLRQEHLRALTNYCCHAILSAQAPGITCLPDPGRFEHWGGPVGCRNALGIGGNRRHTTPDALVTSDVKLEEHGARRKRKGAFDAQKFTSRGLHRW